VLAGRILTGLAAVAMLAVAVLGLAPNPGSSDSGPAHVNCGTVFIDTGWSGEEGCDTQFALRFFVMFFLWLAALVLGTIGLTLLYRGVRYT
jgi:hypothetical protein